MIAGIDGHILRLLADGEMPYRALRKVAERDLGISKVDFCRVIARLDKAGRIERIVLDKSGRLQIVRIGTGKRAALQEIAKLARADTGRIPLAELARRARAEREQPPAVRAVPSDPLGRWWLQRPSA
jgi:hypothetical protein